MQKQEVNMSMDSMPFGSRKEAPSPSSSTTTGSFRIRAPLTVDSDSGSDYEYESNGHDTESTVGESSLYSFDDNNSDEGGEEFETASERRDPADEEDTLELGREGDKKNGAAAAAAQPYVANNNVGGTGLVGVSNSKPVVVPIAQLSMDDEEFLQVLSDEDMVSTEVEDGEFSAVAKVPGAVESSPRVKVVLNFEEEDEVEEVEDESLELKSPVFVPLNKSSKLVKADVDSKTDALEEISKLDEDDKHSAVKTIALETLDDERTESKPVVVDDVNHVSQPMEKPVEIVELVESDTKEFTLGETGLEAGEPLSSQSDECINVDVTEIQGSESKKLENKDELRAESYELLAADTDSEQRGEELMSDTSSLQFASPTLTLDHEVKQDTEDIAEHVSEKALLSDEDLVQLIFGSSEITKHVVNEVEHGLTSTSSLKADKEDQLETAGPHIVVDSDEEEEDEAEREHEVEELLNSAALAALLRAAGGAGSDSGGGLTTTSTDGAPSASSNYPSKVAPQTNKVNVVSKDSVSDEEQKRFEKLQLIRVKFLRLVRRLGHSPDDPMVRLVLYRLSLALGSLFSRDFALESANRTAMQLEAEGKEDLDFSLNIVVLGKTGVGKSASINSIFCEQKARIGAFEPATTTVKEVVGTVDGVKIRILDTPGLRSPVTEEATNHKLLASVKRFVRKFPPDVVLYVDRLDSHDRDHTDFLLLKSLTDFLGSSIWQNAIVTLTHAASVCPEESPGEPLKYEVFVSKRSHVVHRAISQAVGDLRLMDPNMMNPVALVENNPPFLRDRTGESLLPNGQSWRSQLLLLCYSVKILSEAAALSKPQDPFDQQKLFGLRLRSPPLPYLISSLLQSRPHPKLPSIQGGEDVDLDIELGGSPDSDEEDYDEYDQLPPFKPLRKSQVDKLSKEQRKAYFEEYDYRVKLLQKKQWREEVKRLREIKKIGKDGDNDFSDVADDGEGEEGDPATIPVPLPDTILPPSFDGDNPTYRYRSLDSAKSQLLMRPVLESQVWDHDIGYDGVSLERSLAIAGRFPGTFAVQVSKDKKECNIYLDSSVCMKHGEKGSTMAGFDIQTVGKQLAYIFRGETKFRNFKLNQTTAGFSVTFLGEHVATGLKVEDQIAVGNRLVLAGSAGAMTSQGDTAYGANVEIRLKDKDFPVEQKQTTLGLSLVKWRHDLGLMANLQSQFSMGRSSSMAVRVGLNNKQSGQVTLKLSSSDQLHIALASLLPVAASILQIIYPGSTSKTSMY